MDTEDRGMEFALPGGEMIWAGLQVYILTEDLQIDVCVINNIVANENGSVTAFATDGSELDLLRMHRTLSSATFEALLRISSMLQSMATRASFLERRLRTLGTLHNYQSM